jgi:hypothetical protein
MKNFTKYTPPLIQINNDLEQARYLIIPVKEGERWLAALYHKNEHIRNGKKTFDNWQDCYAETARAIWMHLFTRTTAEGSVEGSPE